MTCRSWWIFGGHRFEGRYDSQPAKDAAKIIDAFGLLLTRYDYDTAREAATVETYQRDICTRCGETRERT
jgi:hypothetical protein